MSTHCGASGHLSEHDGEIIEVFTPCYQKIVCSAPGEDPQHTIKAVGCACIRALFQVVTRQLEPFTY